MRLKLSFVRYLFLCVIILSVGCARMNRLREENLSMSQRLQELEGKNALWAAERDRLDNAKRSLE